MHRLFIISFLLIPSLAFSQAKNLTTDVLVIAGSTGGIAAGIQSARSGAKTLIVEATPWLGGMLTAAGVSCTDGNDALPSGIWQEFRQALQQHYKGKSLATGWVSNTSFEPHVADSIFKAWAAKEKNLSVQYGWYLHQMLVEQNKVVGAVFINQQKQLLTVKATITIDATDLGDGFAMAGCAYDLGTEDETQSGEKIAPGKSNVIQDVTWAATLQDFGPGADKTIPKPANYDATKYYCSTTEAPCNGTPYNGDTKKVLNYGKLPVTNSSTKYMLNWPAHGNDYYLNVVNLKPIEREAAYTVAKNHTLGFIYFLQTQLGMKHIGLADEFGTADKLALIPYNREGRRVKGMVRLNINHVKEPYNYTLYRTGIAVGDYPVDHHHAQYPGKVPPIPFPKIPSYSIPLGALIPEKMDGLIVCDKGISVSNIVNGTTRLQPIVLLTGQAAGMLAAECIDQEIAPRKILVKGLLEKLLDKHCFLVPFVDVDVKDKDWYDVQLMGVLGFMQGVGKSEGWANKTYFYPDSLMKQQELVANINKALGTDFTINNSQEPYLPFGTLKKLTNQVNTFIRTKATQQLLELAKIVPPFPSDDTLLTRKQTAHWLNYFLLEMYLRISIAGKLSIR
jgi:hypothetical protein